MRHTSSLCQTCWEQARPFAHFPDTDRWGECCACGDGGTFIARVQRGEVQQVAYLLFATPADRPACCRVADAA
jgi:hypothetical protein